MDVASEEGGSELLCLDPFAVNVPHETDGSGHLLAPPQGLQVVRLLGIIIVMFFYLELPVSSPPSERQVGVASLEFPSGLHERKVT